MLQRSLLHLPLFPMSYLLCIESLTPAHVHCQNDVAEFYCSATAADKTVQRKIHAVSRASGIKNRHSVLPDFSPAQQTYRLFDAGPNHIPGLSGRMQVFDEEALVLSLNTIMRINGFDEIKQKITHIITVTCTGLSAPGLDIAILQQLQLNPSVFRNSVNFMGCNASVLALRQANDICNSNAGALVLIVCTELCTLHFQKEFSDDYIMSNMLFGDGCAAVLVGNDPSLFEGFYTPLFIRSFQSLLVPEGKSQMAWQLSEQGFKMNLSSLVPETICKHISGVFSQHQIDPQSISHWAIHPGGRKILDEFRQTLGLSIQQLNSSYRVLKEHGNMSSATILFVLKDLLNSAHLDCGDLIYTAAFGPGLTIESVIFENV